MKKIAYTLFSMILVAVCITAFTLKENEDRGSHKIDPEVKKEVLKVLDDYMSTFNSKDAKAWQTTYQFPHYRLASGKCLY